MEVQFRFSAAKKNENKICVSFSKTIDAKVHGLAWLLFLPRHVCNRFFNSTFSFGKKTNVNVKI